MHGRGSRGGSLGAAVDRILTDLEAEFDLMRLERYMADLVRKDDRLAEEINALRVSSAAPEGASGFASLPEKGPMRRWGRTLATEGRILLLKARSKRLAPEWWRPIMASDTRFGLRVARSPRD